jgi:hypothetical protein
MAKKIKSDDDLVHDYLPKDSNSKELPAKLIDKINGMKVWQTLDLNVYYEIDGYLYDRVQTILSQSGRLYIKVKEVSLEEFDRLRSLQV